MKVSYSSGYYLALATLASTACVGDSLLAGSIDDPTGAETGTETGSSSDKDGASGMALDNTTETTETTTEDTSAVSGCGNGIVEADELCDDAGESATCDADCTEVECGDMTINSAAGEECDGIDLAGATCETEGLGGGVLTCGVGCTYDGSGCAEEAPEATELSLSFSPIKRFDFSWSAAEGAEYYQLLESASPGDSFVQVGGNILGESLSITVPLYARYEASYVLRACNAGACADSDPVSVMGSLAEAVGYFKASNTGVDDEVGWTVALSDDGTTLVVVITREDSSATGIDGNQADDSASNAGAAYVFVRDGAGQWSQQAYIKASNTDAEDHFGSDVALSGDGNTLAVGARGEDSNATGIDGDQTDDSMSYAGAVYVFVRDGVGQWSQQAYIKASNTDVSDSFGSGVALSGDGNTLAVGATSEDSAASGINGNQADDSASSAGAAYVFVRDGAGQWSQEAYIKASNPGNNDIFGLRLALSGDGSTLAVSTDSEDSNATGIDGNQADDSATNAGAAYVFVRDGAGQWSQQAYIKASNTGSSHWFGTSITLSGDGNILAVGAPGESSNATGIDGDQTDDSMSYAGAVYVFVRDGVGQWSQQAYVKASNTDAADGFGGGLALSGDGHILAASAWWEESNATGIDGDQTDDSTEDAGAVYVFVRDELDQWSQQAYVKATNTYAEDQIGHGLALSGDGNTLAVGAPYEDSSAVGIGGDQADDSASAAGAVYLY